MNDQEKVELTSDINAKDDFMGTHFNEGYAVLVRIFSTNKSYYFHSDIGFVKKNTPVVVETIRGLELGYAVSDAKDLTNQRLTIPLQPLIRIATEKDHQDYEANLTKAKEAHQITQKMIKSMGLDMHLVKVEYMLDGAKLVVMYVADNRVDFRELIRELAFQLHTRIEMRQIGARDRSKIVGGVGICGLPICCNTFLGEFDGISINMAKNQFLALNIQKLSGHCGKLICCLKYEDDEYSELRRGLPKSGQKLMIDNVEYRVASINVLTRQVRLESNDDFKVLPLDQVNTLIQQQGA